MGEGSSCTLWLEWEAVRVDWMGKCVGKRVGRAMSETGVSVAELAEWSGLPEWLLGDRLDAPESFRLDELILIASVMKQEVAELLPCHDAAGGRPCECGDAGT